MTVINKESGKFGNLSGLYSKQEQLSFYDFHPSFLNLKFYDGSWSAKTKQNNLTRCDRVTQKGLFYVIFNAIS